MRGLSKVVISTLMIVNFLFISSSYTSNIALAAGNAGSNAAAVKGNDNDSLMKEFKAKNKHVGIATQTKYIRDGQYAAVLNKEFDMITPEYQMKMGVVEPAKGTFDFSQADEIVKYAQANNKLVRGHALVWHQSLPDWVNNGQFTKSEWIQILKDYITTTVSRYKGKIYGWDVVNEAFWQDGEYRPSIWYTNIGPEYIELAFKFAHEADPNAKLFYNDFNSETTNDKSNAIYKMIKGLKDKGVPISGIGFQTHITIDGLNYDDMKKNLQRFAALGLDTDITEMDVITHTFNGTLEQKLNAEADVYAQVLKVALSLPSVKCFITWGLMDSQSWLNSDTGYSEYPLLFDDAYAKKPAYYALIKELKK